MRTKPLQLRIAGLVLLAAFLLPVSLMAAPAKKKDSWQVRETLASRLGAEWYKIGVLSRELANIKDVLGDVRSFELYPADLTRLDEKKLVLLDKKIESVERRQRALIDQVEELRGPLADAMGILREQVVGQPVEDMFFVIEEGDLQRLGQMLAIKHAIDGLWVETDSLLAFAGNAVHVPPPVRPVETAGFETEFFEIIKANLGMQSQIYYDKLNRMKDTLTARATLEQMRAMQSIELYRIRQYFKNNREFLAGVKIAALKRRFQGRLPLDELNLLLARALFTEGKYYDALAAAAQLPDSGAYAAGKILYTVQSRYALKDFNAILRWSGTFRPDALPPAIRNIVIWMVLESGLAAGDAPADSQFDPARWASQLVRDSSYAMAVMHVLGRYAIARGALDDARAQYESALKFKSQSDFDDLTRKQLRLALADLFFEQRAYGKALAHYFEVLDERDMYDKALYGIIWCYINQGQYQKAEISLRKLINQNPQSPRAVDAMLLMARRNLSKAQYEWKRTTYLSREEAGLLAMVAKVNTRAKADADVRKRAEYDNARNDLNSMLARLKNEPRLDYNGIVQLYKKAADICNFINVNYKTGSFQEIAFSARREYLLHQLDSLLLSVRSEHATTVSSGALFATAQASLAQIKAMVQKSKVTALEGTIDRYRWEREYVDWEKSKVNARQKELAAFIKGQRDSTALKNADMQRRHYDYVLDSLVRRGDSLTVTWQARVMQNCSLLVMAPIDTADAAYCYYHWGEVLYQRENEAFKEVYRQYENALTAYDSLLTLYRSGALLGMPEKPLAPQLDHSLSKARFRTVINDYPDSTMAPAAHYSLAWCYNDQGAFDSAITHMQVVARDRNTQFAPQAWMYIGEYCFDHARLDSAIKAYQAVMLYPESEWFDEALYKLAWTQYRLSNPQKAISSFLALVDLSGASAFSSALLARESMDYIAISFSEIDVTGDKGLARAMRFVTRLNDETMGAQILHRLAGIFKEQGRYSIAAETFGKLLAMFPNYKNSPQVENELVAVSERGLTPTQSSAIKMDYFKKYNKSGAWAMGQTDPRVRAVGDSLAEAALYDGAFSLHQAALQKNDTAVYQTAIDAYTMFIKTYPRSTHANECQYYMAELLFSMGNYSRAAEEYMTVSTRYPDSKYRETAAWNAIVASQNLLKLEAGGKKQ